MYCGMVKYIFCPLSHLFFQVLIRVKVLSMMPVIIHLVVCMTITLGEGNCFWIPFLKIRSTLVAIFHDAKVRPFSEATWRLRWIADDCSRFRAISPFSLTEFSRIIPTYFFNLNQILKDFKRNLLSRWLVICSPKLGREMPVAFRAEPFGVALSRSDWGVCKAVHLRFCPPG